MRASDDPQPDSFCGCCSNLSHSPPHSQNQRACVSLWDDGAERKAKQIENENIFKLISKTDKIGSQRRTERTHGAG